MPRDRRVAIRPSVASVQVCSAVTGANTKERSGHFAAVCKGRRKSTFTAPVASCRASNRGICRSERQSLQEGLESVRPACGRSGAFRQQKLRRCDLAISPKEIRRSLSPAVSLAGRSIFCSLRGCYVDGACCICLSLPSDFRFIEATRSVETHPCLVRMNPMNMPGPGG